MKVTTGPIKHNGPVYIQIKADSPEKAKEIARGIPGITLDEAYAPTAMEDGSYIMGAQAKDVLLSSLPEHASIWDKHPHQMHTHK